METPSTAARDVWLFNLRSLLAGAMGAAIGFVTFFAAVYVWAEYGTVLFVGTPFLMGFSAAASLRRHGSFRLADGFGAAIWSVLLPAAILFLFAFEGLICILMAAPPALAAALSGAWLCWACLGGRTRRARGIAGLLLCLPLIAGSQMHDRREHLRRVVTSVEIEAPPEVVWKHVIGFSELPPPTEAIFRAGIASPRRARLEGSGVGAIRYCEFSTGPFVEPITAWEPGRRLAFDVTSQPEPMHEWSPYRAITAPHLQTGMRSRRGQFLLTALPGGRTRLEGTTWYELHLGPRPYWGLWSDGFIHGIHRRVLDHVRTLAESDAG